MGSNMQPEPDGPDANADHGADLPLCEQVRQSLMTYLVHMDGHGHVVTDLYSFVIREVERPMIEAVLEHCGQNQSRAAQLLGLSRSTLRKKIQQHALD
ncbi:MAG: DNA-binding protein Fis [Pseudomonadota bacterium]|jgi:Fis family transcriptional regulator